MMKNLLKLSTIALFCAFFFGCSVEPIEEDLQTQLLVEEDLQNQEALDCVGDDPKARITNNGSVPIDLDIFDENNVSLGFVHNLLPGETSVWIQFPAGDDILFAVSNDFVEDEKEIHTMSSCMVFDMEFTSSNALSGATPQSL